MKRQGGMIGFAVVVPLMLAAALVFGPAAIPNSRMTVRVRDETRNLVGGASVTVEMIASEWGRQTPVRRDGTTNGIGEYVAENLPAGRYSVSATFKGSSTWEVVELGSSANRVVELTLTLTGATVSGVVRDEREMPVGGVVVQLAGEYPRFVKSSVTSPMGYYEIEGVPDGRFEAVAYAEGYLPAVQQVSVYRGQVRPRSVDLTLVAEAQAGAVSGRVESSAIRSGAYRYAVSAVSADGMNRGTADVAAGESAFQVGGLAAGEYTLLLYRVAGPGAVREVGVVRGVTVETGEETTGVVIRDIDEAR